MKTPSFNHAFISVANDDKVPVLARIWRYFSSEKEDGRGLAPMFFNRVNRLFRRC